MSKIEWTGKTWNPLAGCTPISPGCQNCYAATMAKRLAAMGQEKYIGTAERRGKVDVFTGKINLIEEALQIPLKRKKPTTWFVNSMSDLFHKDVPFEFIDKVFAVMNATRWQLPIRDPFNTPKWHTYQVLTKRPDRMAEYMESRSTVHYRHGEHPLFNAGRGDGGSLRGLRRPDLMNAGAVVQWPPPNVWLGTSCEDQQRANERIPHLLKCPAAVRFLSCEPLLEEIRLRTGIYDMGDAGSRGTSLEGIHWVIAGGESGPGARQCHLDWIHSIVAQCKAASVACFVKQLGSDPWECDRMHAYSTRPQQFVNGLKIEVRDVLEVSMSGGDQGDWPLQLKDRKGGDMAEWPADLRVRQMPEPAATK